MKSRLDVSHGKSDFRRAAIFAMLNGNPDISYPLSSSGGTGSSIAKASSICGSSMRETAIDGASSGAASRGIKPAVSGAARTTQCSANDPNATPLV